VARGNIRVEVYGVVEAMRYLNRYEKDVYKEVKKEMDGSAQPLAQQVGGEFPDRVLTNWNGKHPSKRRKEGKPFPTYEAANARGMVTPKVGIGRVRNGERNILRIQQMSPGGAVLDGAGSKTNNIFTRNLDTYAPTKGKSVIGTSRSRVLYKAVEKRMPMVNSIVARAIELTNEAAQRAINARGKA
jgi:hypothetical protein